MEANNAKAIFLDIDGTLIGNSFEVSERNREAIKKARDAGHYVLINTGRAVGNIPKEFFPFIETVDGIIAGSGSYIRIHGKELLDCRFSNEVLCTITDTLAGNPDLWCVFEGKRTIFGLNRVPDEWGIKNRVTKEKNFRTDYKNEPIEVIAIGKTVPDDIRSKLSRELNIIQMQNFADCLKPGCSKANGIRTAAAFLGVDIRNTYAVGDSENDVSMFEAAGTAIAVANASPTAKAAADELTAANTEDGVALAIEKYLL